MKADKGRFLPGHLDRIIHSPIRLGVIAALYSGGEESFTDLKKIVQATDGNLTIHLQLLEKNEMVRMRKRFMGRRPKTTYRITAKGRRAFKAYMACMESLMQSASRKET